jgi:hypothetical protein
VNGLLLVMLHHVRVAAHREGTHAEGPGVLKSGNQKTYLTKNKDTKTRTTTL